jgi:hypothetical protein
MGAPWRRLDGTRLLMSNSQERRLSRIAEQKGFRVEKAGHGKGRGRFCIISLAEGERMRSGSPYQEGITCAV